MDLEENGVVVEERGLLALVRTIKSSHCTDCGSAKICHSDGAGQEKVVEAENSAGAKAGQKVILALPAGALLQASMLVYLVPVLGLLGGAGLAQMAAGKILSPEAAGMAAGFGGLAGAALALLAGRRIRSRKAFVRNLRPRIVRIGE